MKEDTFIVVFLEGEILPSASMALASCIAAAHMPIDLSNKFFCRSLGEGE